MKRGMALYKREKEETHWFLLLSFLIPALLYGSGLVVQQVHPFGTRQILVVDFWHQYAPFLHILQEKLQHGGSLFFTWDSGMGTNFLAIYAYYAASPLNWLLALIPSAALRDAVTALVVCKIGAAGLCYAIFLKQVFHQNRWTICLFGTLYALCGYLMGYVWNIIWLDTVALFPLVILGLVRIIRKQKIQLYWLSLAAAVISNFYIGWMVCLFLVLAFFGIWLLEGKQMRYFWRCGLLTLLATAGALGLCAVLLLPTYYALQQTFGADRLFPDKSYFYESWKAVLSNFIGYHAPTVKEGLPNIDCGVLPLVLCGLFLRSRLVRLREKLCMVAGTAFLLLSCNWNLLNYIWHGFHFTNMLPYRFSFLISFLLLTAAYRAMGIVEAGGIRLPDWIAMGAVLIALIWISSSVQPAKAVLLTAVTAAGYGIVLILHQLHLFKKPVFCLLLGGIVLLEQVQHVQISSKAVSTSDYLSYPYLEQEVDDVLEQIGEQEADSSFHRVECTSTYTLNDPALYGYSGISLFSSTVPVAVSRFFRSIGLPASEAGNRYYYTLSTPWNNSLIGLSHLIDRTGTVPESKYLTLCSSSGAVFGYAVKDALPFCFVVGKETEAYRPSGYQNPFEAQNDLFAKMTGIREPLFTAVSYDSMEGDPYSFTQNGTWCTYRSQQGVTDGIISCSVQLPQDMSLYGYLSIPNACHLSVLQNGQTTAQYEMGKQAYVFPMGDYQTGDTAVLQIALEAASFGTMSVLLYQMNDAVWERGQQILQRQAMQVQVVTDTTVEGTVETAIDGLLYCAIPYDAGWHAELDGEPVPTTSVGDGAMLAVNVPAGSHRITLHYRPVGVCLGGVISGCSVILCVVYRVFRLRMTSKRKRSKL